MARNSVLKRLHCNNIATKLHRTTSKHGEVHKPVCERTLNKQWKSLYITVRLRFSNRQSSGHWKRHGEFDGEGKGVLP